MHGRDRIMAKREPGYDDDDDGGENGPTSNMLFRRAHFYCTVRKWYAKMYFFLRYRAYSRG